MKKLILLLTMVSLPSFASVSANVSFASDYIWRGMTQSDGPAVQGGFDYASEGGFYAGTAVDINYDLDIKGKAKIQTIVNATNDTDKFLVDDNGEIRYRTGAEVLSDIGAGTGTVTGR